VKKTAVGFDRLCCTYMSGFVNLCKDPSLGIARVYYAKWSRPERLLL
jgi:hypothetical protein